jgi:ubiquinone/menaquinone biosynthesis C-methylase UbiE
MTNLKDFDAVAQQWDEEPRRVKLAAEIAAAIMERIPLSDEWDALDFGCGTGLVTMQLAPRLRSIIGADSSAGMLERLNSKLRTSGISNVCTTLCDASKGVFPAGKYHIITSAMTLHHVEEIAPLLKSLKNLLHPGGIIALADLEAEDGSFHEDPTGVFHNGFSSEELSDLLQKCGFSSVNIKTATTIVKGERLFPVFLATARAA